MKEQHKDEYWFAHSKDAMQDDKILLLMANYGYAGYGRWWAIVEMLRGANGYTLALNGGQLYIAMSEKLKLTKPKAKKFIEDCIAYGLLSTDEKNLWSQSLITRMQMWEKKKQMQKEKAVKAARTKHSREQQDVADTSPSSHQALIKHPGWLLKPAI